MRILHTADWHLGKTLEGRSRLPEQEEFIDELIGIVEDQNIDAVLMAGDAFDTVNPPAAAEQLFYEAITRLSDKGRRPTVVIAGNHDNPDRLAAATPLAGYQGIHLIGYPTFDLLNIEVPHADERLMVAALAYPSEARLQEVLSADSDETQMRDKYNDKIKNLFSRMCLPFRKDSVNMAMSHIYVAGGSTTDSERPIEVGGAYTVGADSLPEAAQYVALGHLHRPQDVKRANTMARYSGSPLAYSFSEIGYTKSVTILDVKPQETPELTELPLSSGKPLVRIRAKGGIEEVYQWLDEGRDNQAWVDLEVYLTDNLSLEQIHRLRKEHPGIIHIRPIFERSHSELERKREANLPIDEMFRRFYEKQTGGAQPDQELTSLFLELINEDSSLKEGTR
ncbi:exonuclease SbcCD subunit D [Metabacillus arenae]|uniref:Nuclease SbcCD subunit D n=1 Tax=Metabacillus arenae TaxID=2771434 RepID=A0A926NBU0_9BACI|nr:exonuclease SbcCD subunit D [Metabacillus arenae]MBD1380624.1 exonuclease SbcCD subunit D [Metabacillus arenae]